MLSSNPDRVRAAKYVLGTLTCRRAAGTGREDPQPDSNPFQLRFAVKRTFYAELRRETESKKAPLEGGWGVSPEPWLRIVGVVGAGLHADASARLVGAPLFLKQKAHPPRAHCLHTLNPRPETLNPQTLSPKPETLAPQRPLCQDPLGRRNPIPGPSRSRNPMRRP